MLRFLVNVQSFNVQNRFQSFGVIYMKDLVNSCLIGFLHEVNERNMYDLYLNDQCEVYFC